MWQDTVIAVCQGFFVIALLPTILSKDKPALATSAMTVVLVSIIAFCLGTLHLWFSVTTAVAIAIGWLVLAIQKAKQ